MEPKLRHWRCMHEVRGRMVRHGRGRYYNIISSWSHIIWKTPRPTVCGHFLPITRYISPFYRIMSEWHYVLVRVCVLFFGAVDICNGLHLCTLAVYMCLSVMPDAALVLCVHPRLSRLSVPSPCIQLNLMVCAVANGAIYVYDNKTKNKLILYMNNKLCLGSHAIDIMWCWSDAVWPGV